MKKTTKLLAFALFLCAISLSSCKKEKDIWAPAPTVPKVTSFAITFEVDGGSAVAPINVENGKTATKPNDPTKANFAFVGWYKDLLLTTPFDFATEKITANTTLYAKWATNTFAVTFEVNGGSVVTSINAESGKTILKPTDPTKAGYTFEGWYNEATFATPFNFTLQTITKATTLYAKWKLDTFDVTFEVNGGSAVAPINTESGKTITKPTDPTKTNFAFVGWYKDVALTTAFDFAADKITANTTLYAKWAISNFYIPDANFRAYLKSIIPNAFTADDYLQVNHADVLGMTAMTIFNKNIADASGIEFFKNLTTLDFGVNKLTSLDLSQNTKLKDLYCNNNLLTSLDVSKNTDLTKLNSNNNPLNSLDVSKNTDLTMLYCINNQLTSLDVSKNTKLKELECNDNLFTSLDVSKNTDLTTLRCTNNQLTSLDVSKNTALKLLVCYKNMLVTLDVSKNTVLTDLYCYNNQLTSLDMSQNTALTNLNCENNQITNLDVSQNTALKGLTCNKNLLTSLDVSQNTALIQLSCKDNPSLSTLLINGAIKLVGLYATGTNLSGTIPAKNTLLNGGTVLLPAGASLDFAN